MDAWPGGLQQKLGADSFEIKFGKTALRTEMDIGPAKVRSRFTDANDIYSCSILLSTSEYATFETFYKTTLNNGVEKFTFTDPMTNATGVFRFKDEPSIRAIGGLMFQVSMLWEKFPV